MIDYLSAPLLIKLLDFCLKNGVQCRSNNKENYESLKVLGIGTILKATKKEISFLSNPFYNSKLFRTKASVILITYNIEKKIIISNSKTNFIRIICKDPYITYALISKWFDISKIELIGRIHYTAVISNTSKIDNSVIIGPNCVIESNVKIGYGCKIGPSCIIESDSIIGKNNILNSRITLYKKTKIFNNIILHSGVVIGSDGFGLAKDSRIKNGSWFKIPQLGSVIINNDVEIGANTTIDRGSLEDTCISKGVKLDNQIMIAHNVFIGKYTAIAACVGIAGSTKIGSRCIIGGSSMISGHINITDDVYISGGTGINSNINISGRYTGGYPYSEHSKWKKNAAVINKLFQMRSKIRKNYI